MIKTLSKLGMKGNFSNLIKTYKRSTAKVILNDEKLEAFPLTADTW